MKKQKQFYSKNFPSALKDEVKETFELPLKNRLAKFEILPDSLLQSVFIGLLYKLDIQEIIGDDPSHIVANDSGDIKLFIFDEPDLDREKINIEQSSKIDVLHLGIKDYMNKLSTNPEYRSLFPISIVCVYNNADPQRFFDDLSFETLKHKGNSKKTDTTNTSFLPVEPIYSLSRVILSDSLAEDIKKTLVLIEKRDIIYEVFGFKEVEPKPKAILNFHGVSGTGKTITAHAIAKELGKKILALNYAEIESKYVGDAPKNLVNAFKCAVEEDAVLFFDEADSFLGKRIKDVSSSSDQAVNSLRSQMLILLEQHEGIVIFATNLIDNYDKAFQSRILKHLKFELPDNKQRGALIKLMLPSVLPYKNDIAFLEEEINILIDLSEGFSGRLIKNSILEALTNAVLEDRMFVTFEDFNTAFLGQKESLKDLNGTDNFTSIKISDDDLSTIEEVVSEELTKNGL